MSLVSMWFIFFTVQSSTCFAAPENAFYIGGCFWGGGMGWFCESLVRLTFSQDVNLVKAKMLLVSLVRAVLGLTIGYAIFGATMTAYLA